MIYFWIKLELVWWLCEKDISIGFSFLRGWWLCTLVTLPLFRASLGFRSRKITPFLVIAQLFPCMFKGKCLVMVVEEDFMSKLEHIILILAAAFLSGCSFIRSTKLAYKIIVLVPTLLTVTWLPVFTTGQLRTCSKVCGDSLPESIRLLLNPHNSVFARV